MKRIIKSFSVVAILAVFGAGCAMTGMNSRTGAGFVFMDNKEALSGTASKIGPKRGEACSKSILGAAVLGDSSVEAAAKAGGISDIATVDTHYFRILSFYGKVCTIVTGR